MFVCLCVFVCVCVCLCVMFNDQINYAVTHVNVPPLLFVTDCCPAFINNCCVDTVPVLPVSVITCLLQASVFVSELIEGKELEGNIVLR